MERKEVDQPIDITADPLGDSPFVRHVLQLKRLHLTHLKAQAKYRLGELDEKIFMQRFRSVMRKREMVIVDAAKTAIQIDDSLSKRAATEVIVSFTTSGSVRLTTGVAFLRNSGIQKFLPQI